MQNKAALLCVLGIVHLICCPGSQWSSGKGLSCAAAHALSLRCPLGFCFSRFRCGTLVAILATLKATNIYILRGKVISLGGLS